MSGKRSKAVKREKVAVPAEMFTCLDDKGENYLIEIELPSVEKKDGAHDGGRPGFSEG